MNKTPLLVLGALASFLVDQYTKWQIVVHYEIGEAVQIIPGHFAISPIRNPGAAFGAFDGIGRVFLMAIQLLAMGFILYIFRRIGRERTITTVSLSLVLGGALGNFVDRAFRGSVVDFIKMTLGSPGDWYFIPWPTYNVADIAICVGVFVLIQQMLTNDANGLAGQADAAAT